MVIIDTSVADANCMESVISTKSRTMKAFPRHCQRGNKSDSSNTLSGLVTMKTGLARGEANFPSHQMRCLQPYKAGLQYNEIRGQPCQLMQPLIPSSWMITSTSISCELHLTCLAIKTIWCETTSSSIPSSIPQPPKSCYKSQASHQIYFASCQKSHLDEPSRLAEQISFQYQAPT